MHLNLKANSTITTFLDFFNHKHKTHDHKHISQAKQISLVF